MKTRIRNPTAEGDIEQSHPLYKTPPLGYVSNQKRR